MGGIHLQQEMDGAQPIYSQAALAPSSWANLKTPCNPEPAWSTDGPEFLETVHLIVVDTVAADPVAVDPAVSWQSLQVLISFLQSQSWSTQDQLYWYL